MAGNGKLARVAGVVAQRGRRLQPRNANTISPAERQRRAAQSLRDRLSNRRGRPAQQFRPVGQGTQVRSVPSQRARTGYMAPKPAARRSGGGVSLQQHVALLRKTIPFSAPTRREPIHFRAALNLEKGQAPVFMFHPTRSTVAWLVVGRENSTVYADIARRVQDAYEGYDVGSTNMHAPANGIEAPVGAESSPSDPPQSQAGHPESGQDGGDGTYTHWWVDGKAVRPQTGSQANIASHDTIVAQGVGTPPQLISNGVRVLGGICHIQMQCGPTIRGFIHYRIVTGPEMHAYSGARIVGELNNPFFYRKPLRPGVTTLSFHAPLENPASIEHFGPVTRSFSNLQYGGDLIEPFASVVISFSEVEYATNDSPPMVTFSSCVNLQCMLPTNVRHLATKDPKTTRDELHKAYTSSPAGEITSGGLDALAGGLVRMVEAGAQVAEVGGAAAALLAPVGI